jgi:hypothetical protein
MAVFLCYKNILFKYISDLAPCEAAVFVTLGLSILNVEGACAAI